ncbi:hypothetical protein FOMPIDRAFT_1049622, partial [Fomitopsis schrenkii]
FLTGASQDRGGAFVPDLQYPTPPQTPAVNSPILSPHPSLPPLLTASSPDIPHVESIDEDAKSETIHSESSDSEMSGGSSEASWDSATWNGGHYGRYARFALESPSNSSDTDMDAFEFDSDYDYNEPQVCKYPNMEHVLDRLTHALDNANAPLDPYDIDCIRSESVRSFRAVRGRANRSGMERASDYVHRGPGSISYAVRQRADYDEHNHPFRGNPILHPIERIQLAELREYFRRHPTSDPQRKYENDTDAILIIIDTLLEYHPAGSYNLALHSRRIRGLLGPIAGFPPSH